MRRLSISEILQHAVSLPDDGHRVLWLMQNDSPTLRAVLQGAFDPNVKWQLPEGAPPYKPNDLVDQHHRLFTETRKLYLFIEGGNPNLNQLRREALFIEFLEALDPDDAKLMLAVKDKQLPYPNITIDIVNKAFPGLIPT
jgi:hypothetical protein